MRISDWSSDVCSSDLVLSAVGEWSDASAGAVFCAHRCLDNPGVVVGGSAIWGRGRGCGLARVPSDFPIGHFSARSQKSAAWGTAHLDDTRYSSTFRLPLVDRKSTSLNSSH